MSDLLVLVAGSGLVEVVAAAAPKPMWYLGTLLGKSKLDFWTCVFG